MSMKQIILAVALALIIPVSAFGLGGSISSPELQFPDRTTQDTISKVLDYLRNDLIFVEGSFVNEFASQGFSGSPTKVTGLIQLLQRSGFGFTVQFSDLKDDRIALRISQNTRQRETVLTINTAKKDFVLSDLIIQFPGSRANVEQGAAPNAALPRR
jgi:hypothetical protein